MNCKEYQNLTPLEKSNYIGQLVHSCMSDSKLYAMGEKLIQQGIKKGLFEKVTINPVIEPLTTDQNLVPE